jgi:hypothetical protein
MHNLADILLHPPNYFGTDPSKLDKELFLYRKQMPNYYEGEEVRKMMEKYE